MGKTCLLTRYVKDSVSKQTMPTIGVEFATTNVTMRDGAVVKAQLWDTAGQERFRTITSNYYRGANGIVVVFDVTDAESYASVSAAF